MASLGERPGERDHHRLLVAAPFARAVGLQRAGAHDHATQIAPGGADAHRGRAAAQTTRHDRMSGLVVGDDLLHRPISLMSRNCPGYGNR